jgi:class 3 adenylate cyclase
MVSAIAVLVFGVNAYTRIRQRQLKLRNMILEKRVEERTAEVVEQGKEIAHQKNRVEELLLNILPKNISDELSRNGEAKARLHPDVTVMFTDMKGFTQVAEKLTPEELVSELHHHFSKFDDIADEYGLEKIKTIGDSYMVACGIPTADPHHAIKVVLAALSIREMMHEWKQARESAGELAWSLRIGLHSGPVVAGVVGKRKFAYDIWGDTVNTASRMESSGEPEKLNVSGTTWKLVERYVIGEYRGKISAKNKGEVDMYFIHGLKPEYALTDRAFRPNGKLKEMLGLLQPDTADLA